MFKFKSSTVIIVNAAAFLGIAALLVIAAAVAYLHEVFRWNNFRRLIVAAVLTFLLVGALIFRGMRHKGGKYSG